MGQKPFDIIYQATRAVSSDSIGLSDNYWSVFGLMHRGQRLIWKISRNRKTLKNIDNFSLGVGVGLNTLAGKKKSVFLLAQTLFIALALSQCIEQCLKIQHNFETLKDLFKGRHIFPLQHKWARPLNTALISPSSYDDIKHKFSHFWHTFQAVCFCFQRIFKCTWKLSNSIADAAHMFSLDVESEDFLKNQAIIESVYNGKCLWNSITTNIPSLANHLEQQELMIDKLFQQIGCQWQVQDMVKFCQKTKEFQTKLDAKVAECDDDLNALGRKFQAGWDSFLSLFQSQQAPEKGTPHRRYIAVYYLKPSPYYAKRYQEEHPYLLEEHPQIN